MRLSPHEQERLMIRQAAGLARDRMDDGLLLNQPEATAVLADWVLEQARRGASVPDLMQQGRHVLTADQVMDGVAALVPEVQMEATFPDGTKLVTIHHPISLEETTLVPGEIQGPDDDIEINVGRLVTTLRVENAGDRPIQIGSHYHFAEANPALDFDRAAAHGQRLDIAAGTAVRFEPGIAREVDLVPFVGDRIVPGLRGETAGSLDAESSDASGGAA